MGKNKEMKCNFKCSTCEYYNKKRDFCKEKEIEQCSKKPHTEFSKCESYLVRKNLIMF